MDESLLARIEDAGLNASAPPQQLWMDGWLVRFSPGKAKRARCINAVATGRLSLGDKLERAAEVYAAASLPMFVRITPFSQPPALDTELAARGFESIDDTRVMVCTSLPRTEPPLPPGTRLVGLASADYAEEVGALRGSPLEQRSAHAQRLAMSPVRFEGCAIRRDADGAVLACAQMAAEADLVGLYDVYTREEARSQGLARLLCERLLSLAAKRGARVAYLQVEADNGSARRVYERLGFADRYAYHYRQAPAGL